MSTTTPRLLIPRDEILDLGDYERSREVIRPAAIAARNLRRVLLGPNATLCFENRETVRYQILEMVRAERIARPQDVDHEIETYSELLPSPDALSGTLLIEFPEKDERDVRLAELLGFDRHLRIEVDGAGVAGATFDQRQIDDVRLSSVQFVRFPITDAQAAAIRSGKGVKLVCDHPKYNHATTLSHATVKALGADLDEAVRMESSAHV